MKASVIIPTNKGDSCTIYCLKTVCKSVDLLPGSKEFIIVLDAPKAQFAQLINQLSKYSFTKFLQIKRHQGVAYARSRGINKATGNILLFTDADCVVKKGWAKMLFERTQKFGICTGKVNKVHISKRPNQEEKVIAELEEYTDKIRVVSKNKEGEFKFISFPNFGIKKNKILAFDLSKNNTTDDIWLAAKLRLSGEKIYYASDIVVKTIYPNSIFSEIKRKFKHGKGIAWLRYRLGFKQWKKLGFETFGPLFMKWTKISLNSPFSLSYKIIYLIFNLTYLSSLYGHFLKFKIFKT